MDCSSKCFTIKENRTFKNRSYKKHNNVLKQMSSYNNKHKLELK